VEQENAQRKAKDMRLSPLDRAIAGLEAVAMAGSAMFESIQQAPKLLQGEDAYAEAIGKRMYMPRQQPEKAMEYLDNALNFVDRLQTEYKLPPIMPELAGFQPLMAATQQQVKQGVKRGALQAGMGLERALDQPVTDIMNRGGIGSELLGSFNTQPAQVVKPKGGNWRTSNMSGGIERSLQSLKPYTDQTNRIDLQKAKIASMENAGSYLPESIQNAKAELAEIESQQAINNWIERNVGNYVKKDMATPTDPVRLMMDKRVGEIEAQFQVDMDRAQRTRARAEAEPDPRRQANMMRQAQREEEQATFDRDFAMDHVTHLPKDEFGPDEDALIDLQSKRQQAGFAPEGMATSEPAKRWENISDEAIDIKRAGDIQAQKQLMIDAQNADRALAEKNAEINQKFDEWFDSRGVPLTEEQKASVKNRMSPQEKATLVGDTEYEAIRNNANDAMSKIKTADWHAGEQNPYISKLDPETSTYSAYIDELGIDHVVDVIKQDLAAGRIRPEQLNKLSMDQAIQRTAEFNMEQAKKMRETAIKNMEGFPTYKEYGDEGYKWIELKRPEDLTELPPTHQVEPYESKVHGGTAYRVVNKETGMKSEGFKTPERATQEFLKEHSEERLAEALKYEGDTMGHCVGGYCPDVLEGRSRIYSLRDKRGEPHVTVEVTPKKEHPYHSQIPEDVDQQLRTEGERIGNQKADEAGYSKFGDERDMEVKSAISRARDDWAYNNPIVTQSIRQIKGKQNAAPKADYLPYVQDFVRSAEWTDVGDLKNTGLVKYEGKIMTQSEADDLLYKQLNADMPGITDELGLTNPPPEPPIEGMKRGGAVSISDNPDTMMMELEDQKFAVGGAAIKRVLKIADHAERAKKAQELLVRMSTSGQVDPEAQRALLKAQSGARSLPTVLPRAKPKTKDEIRAYAQRTADQLNAIQQGKFLREDPTGASINAAGKSKKQWEMEQGLTHDIRPLGLPLDPIKTANIEDQLGMLKLGISGDTSISDQKLYRAGQYGLQSPSEQQGGPYFGLRKRADPAAWASNVPVLENLQRDVGEFSRAYGDVPVIGQYNSMGPQGTNFAQHFADANLEAIASHGLTPSQAEQVNNLIKMGNAKSGAFPDFPGVEDPAGAYFYFSFYPELRKHFNDIMTKPDITTKLGLPDGRVILHAITDPELRDMPLLTSGKAQYQLVPSQDPKNLPLSEHSTYTHNLPRDPDAPVTQTPFPIPAEFEFSDVTEYAKPRYKPSEMTRVIQTAAPRQIVDPQHIDEIKQYEDFMRQYTPQSEKKKDGGLIKVKRKAGGGIIKKAIKAAGKAVEAPATKRLEMSFKDVAKPVPELTEASQKLKAGQLSREEYEALVNKHKPVTPYSFVPQPATAEDANRALNVSQRTKFGKVQDITPGTPTGLRLDINAYKDHGVWVNSIHPKDMPTTYNNVSSVTNAEMVMPEEKALEVATREKNKSPFAVIKGGWNPISEEDAVARAQEYLNHPDWVQVGIDPERHGYYYNRATMEPIVRAEEVIQIGPLVLAKKPVTAPKEAFKYARGGVVNANDLILTERPL
jgi:hypothetical protein